MSRDLDAMHYGRTGKNHNARENAEQDGATEEDDANMPGDPELWDKLR